MKCPQEKDRGNEGDLQAFLLVKSWVEGSEDLRRRLERLAN